MAIDWGREKVRGPGAVWVGGLAIGALAGWALLTQTFPIVVVAALLWFGFALGSRRAAALGGLLLGTGAASVVLTVGATWLADTWIWGGLSLALIASGSLVTYAARPGSEGVGNPVPTLRKPKTILAVVLAVILVVAWAGLPLRPGEYALATTAPGAPLSGSGARRRAARQPE
jgi:peptidoglycan/LPS O-acetylase OafA/YrhL